MPMYTLFCSPNTYAMSAHAILEEIGVDYAVQWVELFQSQPDAAFLAASPHARVPALLTDTGTLCETGAIAFYLAERHAPDLLIAADEPARGRFLQWFHYLASTLQPEVIMQFHPEFYAAEPRDQQRLRQASMRRLTKVLGVLDAALRPGPYFFGDRLSICDFLLCLQAVWPEIHARDIARFPGLQRLVETMRERPSVKRVLQVHAARTEPGDLSGDALEHAALHDRGQG